MPRFKLVPLEQKSAMEQLFDCASLAVCVIASRHKWWHLHGDYRDELFEILRDATVANFITYKVRRHGYRRVSDKGQPLNFADNVISSCFSVSGNLVDTYMKRLTQINSTQDIEPVKYCLGHDARLPLYLSNREKFYRYKGTFTRPSDRAKVVRREYEEYVEEAKEMGLTEILELGPWLTRNGYGQDSDLFLYMESKDARRRLLQGQARWMAETKQAGRDALILNNSVRRAQIYNREWKKRQRRIEWKRRSLEFEKLFGPPPEGHIWKERRGVVGLYKLKEDDK